MYILNNASSIYLQYNLPNSNNLATLFAIATSRPLLINRPQRADQKEWGCGTGNNSNRIPEYYCQILLSSSDFDSDRCATSRIMAETGTAALSGNNSHHTKKWLRHRS
jgi:hypothetical protein